MSFFFSQGMGGGGFPGMGGGGGGMPGGGGEAPASDGESTDNKRFYELLNVDPKATLQQIKKGYRKVARELHPDRHPDNAAEYEAKFQEVQQAHEVLSDPSKRKLYDRYGEAGLRSGGGSSSGQMSDIFDMFFQGSHGHGHGHRGGGGGRQAASQSRRKKAPVIREFVDVTLRDLYIGSPKDITFKRMQVCKDCAGKGGKKIVTCSGCHGSGTQIVIQNMGYMRMQTQRRCPQCQGEGTSIPEKDKCKKCAGQGFKSEKKTLNFDVPMGSKHADKIVLHAQGHEIPDAANGDLVIVLRCTKHAIFNRVGADLAMTYKISLKQALCGFSVVIPHLSGYKLRLSSKAGEIVKHGQLKAVYSKGMPQKGSVNVFGHLYVKFEIVFPENGELNESVIAKIKQLLPKGDNEEDSDEEIEEHTPTQKNPSASANSNPSKNNNNNNNNNGENTENTENGSTDPSESKNEVPDDEDGLEENVEDYEMHEVAEDVDGEPSVTPASSRSAYDEDDEQEGVSCRQM